MEADISPIVVFLLRSCYIWLWHKERAHTHTRTPILTLSIIELVVYLVPRAKVEDSGRTGVDREDPHLESAGCRVGPSIALSLTTARGKPGGPRRWLVWGWLWL